MRIYQRAKRFLTWATVEEACELRPLALYKRFFRAILPALLLAAPVQADDLDYLRLRLRLLELSEVSTPVVTPIVAPVIDEICKPCDGEGAIGGARCEACGGDGRTSSVQPVSLRSDGIAWMSYVDACKDGRPIWVHVTDSTGCLYCRKADKAFADPEVIVASENYACVVIDRNCQQQERFDAFIAYFGLVGDRERYPADIFLSPSLTTHAVEGGCPSDYVARLERNAGIGSARSRPIVVVEAREQQYQLPQFRFMPTPMFSDGGSCTPGGVCSSCN
jgi:hypothetical protein